MARGVSRTKDGWANQDSVRVVYDNGQTLEMSEEDYAATGYEPPFDSLPWTNDG